MIKFDWKLNGRSVAPGQLGREPAKSVHGEIVSRAKSAVRNVSDGRHNPDEDRHLAKHIEGHRFALNCLIGNELVRFGVRRYTRPESISKRAPSSASARV